MSDLLSSAFCIPTVRRLDLRRHGAHDRAMIRCHLSRLMGEGRVRLIDVARATRISRNMLAKLYYDRARRMDLGDLNKLGHYSGCSVGGVEESVPDRLAHREQTRRKISAQVA